MSDEKVKFLAKKWYEKLDFPKEYDEEFYSLLEKEHGFSEIKFSDFDLEKNKTEYSRNVIWTLYFCEEVSQCFKERGIPEAIMMETLLDIRFVIIKYSRIFGCLSLKGIDTWVNLHLSFKLFKIGRLQYEIRGAEGGAEHLGLKEGTPVLAIHIPAGEKLTRTSALESIESAKIFFKEYFPEYEYGFFTCHSWLLDLGLNTFLPQESNIIQFQNLFTHACDTALDSAIAFTFPHGVTRENITDFSPKTSLQEKIKNHVASGGLLYYSYGIIKK